MSLSHFKRFNEIRRAKGVGEALSYDVRETGRRISSAGTGVYSSLVYRRPSERVSTDDVYVGGEDVFGLLESNTPRPAQDSTIHGGVESNKVIEPVDTTTVAPPQATDHDYRKDYQSAQEKKAAFERLVEPLKYSLEHADPEEPMAVDVQKDLGRLIDLSPKAAAKMVRNIYLGRYGERKKLRPETPLGRSVWIYVFMELSNIREETLRGDLVNIVARQYRGPISVVGEVTCALAFGLSGYPILWPVDDRSKTWDNIERKISKLVLSRARKLLKRDLGIAD